MADSTPASAPGLDLRNATNALEALAKALVVHIEGDGRTSLKARHPGLPVILSNFARMSDVTWRSLRVLLSDKQSPTDLFVAAGPLVRTLLEATMSLVFMGEDLVPRLVWYFRSGWRDAASLQARLERRHGKDAQWQPYLSEHRAWVESHEADFGITPAERADPKTATPDGWWPNPGRMVKVCKDTSRKAFLRHVNDWAYGELSGNAHLAYMGLARTASLLHDTATAHAREVHRSKAIRRSITLFTAVLSEVAVLADARWARERAAAIWGMLKVVPEAVELHETDRGWWNG